ncbi:hypothetical protein EPN87_01695 [archaeon]|nr:MAG: hypothetical protein EPN87_01695 [archaeon]
MAEKESWKDFLTDDARETLEGLLAAARKHRGAYEQSDDKKVALLWSALIEMKKELEELKAHTCKLDEPFKAIVEVGESEKKKAIERLVTQIIKPVDQDSQEATQKLVDSLMDF